MPRKSQDDGTAAVVTTNGTQARNAALMRALGLDTVPEPQRELALAIANRYSLDPMLKHLVLIDGRPYITRDGLLWVAHRSHKLDGIEVTEPVLADLPGLGQFWTATASVYRKDMSRPFVYRGRYPKNGSNQRYAPEMAVKVAEVMSLRRAFAVAAPVIEEQWEQAAEAVPEAPTQSLGERIAARQAALDEAVTPDPASFGQESGHLPDAVAVTDSPGGLSPAPVTADEGSADASDHASLPPQAPLNAAEAGGADVRSIVVGADVTTLDRIACDARPSGGNAAEMGFTEPCYLTLGHRGAHRSAEGTWA